MWGSSSLSKIPKKVKGLLSSSFKSVSASVSSRVDITGDAVPVKLFQDQENLNDKLVAVVVTICSGSSYDQNFTEVRPETVQGERVSTYQVTGHQVPCLLNYLRGHEAQGAWRTLVDDIRQVEPDSVTFNWECCSGCSEHGFGCDSPVQLMDLAIQRGHTVMCSDFSLKALIKDWSEATLGPNPFVQLGTCDNQFQLDFLSSELTHEDVPQQLQVVGELCREQGKAIVTALGGTILYTVNPRRVSTSVYSLKVLTVVSDWGRDGSGDPPQAMRCSVGTNEEQKWGFAGHVTLTYASGGQLVTSMGHWIELTRIDTSIESVMRVAQRNFGAEKAAELSRELASRNTEEERCEYMQQMSKQYVQQSVPSKMKSRTKY